MKHLLGLLALIGWNTAAYAACPPGLNSNDAGPPMDLFHTFVLDGSGLFAAPRESGNPHDGCVFRSR